jgi:hypothetical protein
VVVCAFSPGVELAQMDRFHKFLVLLFVAGIPAAATPFLPDAAPPPKTNITSLAKTAVPLCFTAGSITYELSQNDPSPNFRVKFDDAAARPDLRIGLVDGIAAADFTLVDDVIGMDGNACNAAGLLKTVKIVGEGPSDVVISLTRDLASAEFKLFVHSARFNHRDAAALFAVMRQNQAGETADENPAD